MTQIATSLRTTKESARLIRYEPLAPFTATNVQDAIGQAAAPRPVPTYTFITQVDSPYMTKNTDSILLVNTSAGSVTINLQGQSARGGLDLTIKDDTGNASTNPISLVPAGGETVDGLSPYPIDSDFGGVTIAPQAGGYFIKP